MENRFRTLALLSVALLIGGYLFSGSQPPLAEAQSKTDVAETLPKEPPKPDHPAKFPSTENPDVARVYATAYIVGEALRYWVIDTTKKSGESSASELKNLVKDIYSAMK